VLLLVPAIWWGTLQYGVLAAPVAWIVLNFGYFVTSPALTHRRLLQGENRAWYGSSVMAPVVAAVIAPTIVALGAPAADLSAPWSSAAAILFAWVGGTALVLASRPVVWKFALGLAYDQSPGEPRGF
jgi:hypothetical protein